MLALVAAIALIAVPDLPCGWPGGGECAPDDEAIALVPGDSTAYVHVVTARSAEQYEQAEALAERFPTVIQQVVDRLPAPRGASFDYQRDVAPWLGGEAALALVPAGGGKPRTTVLLEVATSAARAASSSGSRGAIRRPRATTAWR